MEKKFKFKSKKSVVRKTKSRKKRTDRSKFRKSCDLKTEKNPSFSSQVKEMFKDSLQRLSMNRNWEKKLFILKNF